MEMAFLTTWDIWVYSAVLDFSAAFRLSVVPSMALFTSLTVPLTSFRESRSPSKRPLVSCRKVDVVDSMPLAAEDIFSKALTVPAAAVRSEEMSSRFTSRLSTRSDWSASSAIFTTVFMASRAAWEMAFTNFSLTSPLTASPFFSVTMEAMAFFLSLE